VNKESEKLREDVEHLQEEKAQILSKISKQRLKALKSIAVKFPKLNNLEENAKFKTAIKELYEDADLSKHIRSTDQKRMSVDEILESHSPGKVLLRYRKKQIKERKS
jgi:hypothetical protein